MVLDTRLVGPPTPAAGTGRKSNVWVFLYERLEDGVGIVGAVNHLTARVHKRLCNRGLFFGCLEARELNISAFQGNVRKVERKALVGCHSTLVV